MIREALRNNRAGPSIVLGCLLAATPVLAAPGDPLGGDDTGCAPSTKLGVNCAKKALASVEKLRQSVLKCHLKQANAAFAAGVGGGTISSDEETCTATANAQFDSHLATLSACDATVIANANARRDIVLDDRNAAGSMDNLNATFFCDATTGNEIDPGGDDGGFTPPDAGINKCSIAVAREWSRLTHAVYLCHTKLAAAVFGGKTYDEDACEDTGTRSALAKYNSKVNRYISAGICPPCLADAMSATSAVGLGTSAVADDDANLQELYICPGP